jgi:hypothetical protein
MSRALAEFKAALQARIMGLSSKLDAGLSEPQAEALLGEISALGEELGELGQSDARAVAETLEDFLAALPGATPAADPRLEYVNTALDAIYLIVHSKIRVSEVTDALADARAAAMPQRPKQLVAESRVLKHCPEIATDFYALSKSTLDLVASDLEHVRRLFEHLPELGRVGIEAAAFELPDVAALVLSLSDQLQSALAGLNQETMARLEMDVRAVIALLDGDYLDETKC